MKAKPKPPLTFKIEHGIPIPSKRHGEGITLVLKKLKAGDSFIVPASYRPAVYMAARRNNIPIATRLIRDGQVRVWKILMRS